MGIEDCFEATSLLTAGQPAQARFQATGPSGQPEDGREEYEDGDAQPDDGDAEVRLDERVEVDPEVLRWGRPSLAGHPRPAVDGGPFGDRPG